MKIRNWTALLLAAAITVALPACGKIPAGHVAEIEYMAVPVNDWTKETDLLKSGRISMISGNLTVAESISLKEQEGISLISTKGSYTMDCVFFNMRRSPCNEPIFRKAVASAINREYITQTLLQKSIDSCDTFVPPLSKQWTDQGAKAPGFDIAKTRMLLNEAGYTLDQATGKRLDPKTGMPLKLTLLTPVKTEDPVRWSIGYTLAYYLNAMGVETEHMAFSKNTLNRITMESREYDILIGEITMAAEPYGLYPLLHSSADKIQTFAYSGLHDDDVDKNLEILWTSRDEQEAMTAAKSVQDRLAELLPYAPVCMKPDYMAVNGDWKGIADMPGEGAWNLWSSLSMYPAGEREVGILKIAAPGGIINLNPLLDHTASEWDVLKRIYSPLFYPDQKSFNNTPVLAKDWVVEDWTDPDGRKGMKVVFHLKEGITWHDGEPFTSEDIKFCLDYLKANQVPLYKTTTDIVSNVQVPNDATVEIYLTDQGYRHIYELAGMTFLPQHIWKDVKDYKKFEPWAIKGAKEGTTKLVGQGPFILQGVDSRKGAKLIWNPDYVQPAE